MRVFAGALAAALLAGSAHCQTPAQDSSDVVLSTLRTVCQPSSERSVAARNLATAAGFAVESSPPDVVRRDFPAAALGGVSLSKAIGGGSVHVVSAVIPPPATPYSCLIVSDVDAPTLIQKTMAAYSGPPSRYRVIPDTGHGAVDTLTLNASDGGDGPVDKIIVLRRIPSATSPALTMVLAYRVTAKSLAAAEEIKNQCAQGTSPHPETLCPH
jgi:hypothetical protein